MGKQEDDPLKKYFSIIEGKLKPNYLKCKSIPIDIALSASEEELWKEHDDKMNDFHRNHHYEEVKTSLLDLKVEIAKRILMHCSFCERRCGVNRMEGERGHCSVLKSRVASDFIHWGEEPELVPSYTIFFSGCTFNCVYCQNWDISQNSNAGRYIKSQILAEMIGDKIARNVNWVGGDPTPNLGYILEVLRRCEANLAQVWNSNMYLTEESMKLLNGTMDVYLTDFKYGNDNCAKRLSNVVNYWEIITRNHMISNEQGEVIIRHLVLPNHLKCCSKPILQWISKNLKNVKVNVMAQYRPEYKASKYDDLKHRLKYDEFLKAHRFAKALKLDLTE